MSVQHLQKKDEPFNAFGHRATNEDLSVASDLFIPSAGRRTERRRMERCSYASADPRASPVSVLP